MQSQANVVNFAEHRRLSSAARAEEFTFANMEELLAFVGGEIVSSKRKFAKIAQDAHLCATTVSKIAYGETRTPHAATIFSILASLGYEVVVRR